MIQVNAMGDACPIPVVKTKNAIKELNGAGTVETLVDNEIAVQNLKKMASVKGYEATSEQLGPNEFKVTMVIGEGAAADDADDTVYEACDITPRKKKIVVQISADHMGEGGEQLGKNLLKGFIYALSQQDVLPDTILCYNGGASITCEDSPALEDLKAMAAEGVEILTCGTCLDFFGLKEKLAVGEVTNMYVIVEKLSGADLIIRP
ncbi:MAG: sulfurtransferase-like selenium metabolism protein YedF [Lachnospiraceae bacterium]|nr:sulfurtransferase-like selenium metabolism protein YedF [Lachnospiraceae bacterium]